ncbi:PKD domain-containing protein [Methanospirillum sp.]|uniref:PKD domain-containing protein n=1 Tax=Methanospirillum sp. TaxID=45200 RepID=UPI00359FE8EC
MKTAPLLMMVLALLLLVPCLAEEDAVEFEPIASFSAEAMIAQAPGFEEQMTFDSIFDWDPRVDEQYVTWTQYEGQGKVWFYDMKTGNRQMVANINSDQNNPDISGGIIVWDDSRHKNSDIYSYNIPMHKEAPVHVDTTNKFKPAVSQDMVVFEDFGNDDIRDIGLVKVGTSARPVHINPNGKDKANPDIDEDWIAYQQLDDNKNDWNIYIYNYKTDKTVQVTRDTRIQQNPRISGDFVVWEDNRNGKWDIFMYDIKKEMTTAVTFDDFDNVEPAVSGSKIVWTRYDQENNSDIYMVDLQIPKTYAVCVGPGNQMRPDICVDKIVWQDDRFGGWNIFIYTLEPATPFTPYQFYGPVTFNYLPAQVGTEIIAKIDGVTKDSIVTTQQGYYGSSGSFGDQLTVKINQADIGRQISFWSDGIQGAPSITITGDGSLIEQPLNFVYAQPLPDLLFYGSVTIDGQPAAKGTILKAVIDGVVRGSYDITQSGQYGGQYDTDPALCVQITVDDIGKHITFMEGEYAADQTFQVTSGGRFRQDLTFSTVPPMSPYEFYGYVQIDGKSAPIGTTIQAKIDNVPVTTYVTRYAGSYGTPGQSPDDPRLIVPVTEADAGRTISFWIGTIKAGTTQVITRGGERIIRKDLDFGSSPQPGIQADFTASPRSGTAPLTVQFTDLSTGGPTLWYWDFGDGIIPADVSCSSETDCHNIANPIHTYRSDGTFTVTLTASNQFGASDTKVKSGFITVGNSPQPVDSIRIYPGWNFISVPRKLAPGKDTAAIFSHIQVDGHSIFQYDAVTGQWITMTSSSLIKPLDAVWIYSRTTDTVPLIYNSDPLQTPPTKELRKGWNAVGFTGLEPLEARFTLLSIQDKWVNCLGFNEEKQQYDEMIIKGRNDDSRLYPHSGYWLFMSDNGTLAAISA